MAKLIQVIETEERRGDGRSKSSPMRVVRQWWTTDGVLLAEDDPCSQVVPIEQAPPQDPTR